MCLEMHLPVPVFTHQLLACFGLVLFLVSLNAHLDCKDVIKQDPLQRAAVCGLWRGLDTRHDSRVSGLTNHCHALSLNIMITVAIKSRHAVVWT